jgi:hypothetical protein
MTFLGCFIFHHVHFVSDLYECSVKRYSILAVTGTGVPESEHLGFIGEIYFVVK